MIKIGKRDPKVAVRTTMALEGQEFDIELIPLPEEERLQIFSPYVKRKYIHNPVTKKMDEVSYFQDEEGEMKKKSDDLLDKHIVNFWGVGTKDGPLDGSLRENKLLLASIEVDDIEEIPVEDPQTKEVVVIRKPIKTIFRAKILDKCVELSKTIVEAETKN